MSCPLGLGEVDMKTIRVLLIFISTLLLQTPASAQIWPIQQILDRAQGPVTLLFDKNGTQVDSVNLDWLRRFDNVATRLAIAYGIPMPDLLLSKSNGPNAYVTVGKNGPVMVVMTDMLRIIGNDEGLTAALIGHELGHLAANHPIRGGNDMSAITNLGQLVGAALDAGQAQKGIDTQGLGKQLGSAGAALINAKYSRDQERVADELGIRHMASAGFNPDDASRLIEVMGKQFSGGNGMWTASHPSFPERYQTLLNASKSLQDIYKENRTSQVDAVDSLEMSKRDIAVSSQFPDWRVLRESALFSLWLTQEPDVTGDKLDSSKSEDVVAVMKSFQSALPSLSDAAFARKDYAVAFEGYEYLGNKGDIDAQVRLGKMYQLGLGTTKNEIKAKEWLQKASIKGNVEATALLNKLQGIDSISNTLSIPKTSQSSYRAPESNKDDGKDIEKRLTELKSLFNKGLISKQDFNQKRLEILKSL